MFPLLTKHLMPGFYGLDMLLRYIHGVNNDMGMRKEGRGGSPSADAFTIRMECKHDEGKIINNITVWEQNVNGIRRKLPFRPLTYALTRNSNGSRRILVKMTFYSRRLAKLR